MPAIQGGTLLRLRFGGGRHTRISTDSIDERESGPLGQNFVLEPGNTTLRSRRGIELVGTAPNEGRINGWAQLFDSSGSLSTLVQAGTEVYPVTASGGAWSFGSSKGTVSSDARLRGRLSHNWNKGGTDKVIITDLGLQENIHEYDGTTFQAVSTTGVTNFKAKYCEVRGARAFYGNVNESSTDLSHVIVASDVEDFTTLDASNQPSSSLGADKAFFIPMPDLRPVNGLSEAFDKLIISTQRGRFYQFAGFSAKDAEVIPFLAPGEVSESDEALAVVNGRLVYGRPFFGISAASPGRGDVDTLDLSQWISDEIDTVEDWLLVYNSRLQRVYCFPAGIDAVHVLFLKMLGTGLSPWSKFTSLDSTISLDPTIAWSMFDPVNSRTHSYFGDSSGNVYKIDGVTLGDRATQAIPVKWESATFSAEREIRAPNSWIRYIPQQDSASVTVTAKWAGFEDSNQASSVTLEATDVGGRILTESDTPILTEQTQEPLLVEQGGAHDRVVRQWLSLAGEGADMQITIEAEPSGTVDIAEIAFPVE